jgi:23S rRNA pseudouridine2605 synthase
MRKHNNSPKSLKTLERILSKAGICSRTDARAQIRNGKVRVNGQVVTDPDSWVDRNCDRVTFEGKPLRPAQKVYVLLYKPTGYVTTFRDPDRRPTVYDLLKEVGTWVSPVGRLDLETSGLLLLTNDNDFTETVTNPKSHTTKTYHVKAASLLTDQQIESLRAGVELKDGPTRPAQVKRLRDGPRHTYLEITITEGRNRQVRRMLEAVDSKVLKLVRTAIGSVRIADLTIGKWRNLTPAEVAGLLGRSPKPGI